MGFFLCNPPPPPEGGGRKWGGPYLLCGFGPPKICSAASFWAPHTGWYTAGFHGDFLPFFPSSPLFTHKCVGWVNTLFPFPPPFFPRDQFILLFSSVSQKGAEGRKKNLKTILIQKRRFFFRISVFILAFMRKLRGRLRETAEKRSRDCSVPLFSPSRRRRLNLHLHYWHAQKRRGEEEEEEKGIWGKKRCCSVQRPRLLFFFLLVRRVNTGFVEGERRLLLLCAQPVCQEKGGPFAVSQGGEIYMPYPRGGKRKKESEREPFSYLFFSFLPHCSFRTTALGSRANLFFLIYAPHPPFWQWRESLGFPYT